jgi:hypothetical protein
MAMGCTRECTCRLPHMDTTNLLGNAMLAFLLMHNLRLNFRWDFSSALKVDQMDFAVLSPHGGLTPQFTSEML